jgi:hypothetical protein
MNDETWDDICRVDRLCYEVAFENGDMDNLRREMDDLLGEEYMRNELKKRLRPDWAYDGFSYAITMVDIIRDRFYHDHSYRERLFGAVKEGIERGKVNNHGCQDPGD